MEEVSCNICNSNQAKSLFKIERHKLIFTIKRCTNCGLVYLSPRPPSSELQKYYADVYNYDGFLKNAEGLKNKGLEDLKFIQQYKQNGNLLEVGCMYGFMLDQARKQGFNTYGVEISKKATDYARENLALDIFNGRLEDNSFDDQFFDVIFLSHLIEHLEDPMSSIKTISRIIKSDGVLIIKCPNFGSLMSRITHKYWWWIAPPEHLYHFTARTITSLLKKAGFNDITIFTNHGDLTYLRYLTVGAMNFLPVSRARKAAYRAKIDEQPNHISQKVLMSIYKLSSPVINMIHKARLGEEMTVVARK